MGLEKWLTVSLSFVPVLAVGFSLWSGDFQNSCVPQGRIHGKTRGCKWSLLKFREGNYKREHGGCRWNLEAERASLLQVLLKLMLTYGKGGARWFPSNNHWVGGVWVVPSQVRAVPELEHGQSEMQYFSVSPELSLILVCLICFQLGANQRKFSMPPHQCHRVPCFQRAAASFPRPRASDQGNWKFPLYSALMLSHSLAALSLCQSAAKVTLL
jgi:hypothetical protein